jgi:hypothetical protein
VFDNPVVARVSVGTGLFEVLGGLDAPVMDDFIYGEPIAVDLAPVPIPAGLLFGLTSIASLAAFRRRRKKVVAS